MAKLPWMQFYPADWVRDTVGLSANARAAWIDIICFLWDYKTRGQATRTSFRWASIVRLAPEEFNEVLAEFDEHEICDISVTGNEKDATVTIMSRRMMREEEDRDKERKDNRLRQKRHREKVVCHADVTPESRTVTRESHISEVRSQKSELEKKEKITSPDGDSTSEVNREFETFWEAYPKRNGKRIGKTRSRELFSRLSKDDQRNCVIAGRHYADSQRVRDGYCKDPERFIKADFWREWIEPETPQALALKPQRFSPTAAAMAKVRELEAMHAKL